MTQPSARVPYAPDDPGPRPWCCCAMLLCLVFWCCVLSALLR